MGVFVLAGGSLLGDSCDCGWVTLRKYRVPILGFVNTGFIRTRRIVRFGRLGSVIFSLGVTIRLGLGNFLFSLGS